MPKQINKMDFKGQNIYCGIDVHNKSWKTTILVEDIFHKTFSHDPEPKQLSNYLHEYFPGGIYHAAYEAGFCGFWIQKKLQQLGINTIVTHAADIPTTDKEKRQKEDKRDSQKIARALKNGDIEAIYVPSDIALENRLLVRARFTIAKDLRRNKHRIKAFLFFYGIRFPEEFSDAKRHWSKKFICWLESIELKDQSGKEALGVLIRQIKSLRSELLVITRQIRALSKTERFKEDCDLLRSIPGIGENTTMRFLTEIVDIKRFSSLDKLASYIGFIPSTNSSGEKQRHGDITPRGHKALRTLLVEDAWIAIGKDPSLMASYYKLCKRMDGNKAIVRIAKKLLARMAFVLRERKKYEIYIG
ncbi:IS110 family transposase [Mariniphaga sp.]|uniref:IS110 family transposase n=1 Tax=Mariniphaga sp. TaxID=1954475 RepID=UPI00356778B0